MTQAPLETPPAGFTILKSVDGLENDLLMSRTGRILHPTSFEEIFDHTPGVGRCRATQKADGSLVVTVESMDRQATLDSVILLQKLLDRFEGYPVEVDFVRKLPSLASGKHRWILSERKSNLHTG